MRQRMVMENLYFVHKQQWRLVVRYRQISKSLISQAERKVKVQASRSPSKLRFEHCRKSTVLQIPCTGW